MKKTISKFKRSISVILTAALIAPAITLPVHAEATDVYIPELEMEEGILNSDVFYLTASSAQLKEGANERYLLRLARGGESATDSTATIKIADLSARYGKDYTISVVGSDAEVDNPSDNESLIERMEGEEYTETELKTEEEYSEMLENDEELQKATEQGVQDVIDYLEDASGVLSTENTNEGEATPTDGSETVSTDPLQQARATFTGVEGEPQNVTSTTDTMQQIQQMANVMTNAVVGATLKVDFAAGESEKYIAIDVKDNNDGDGYRYFFLMLGAPEGTTTNSASSSCSLTIVDDEEQAPAKVSFTESSYDVSEDSVTVEIKRDSALNTISAAHLTTENGTAQAGRDFSPVDMDVVFPMGIDTRKIEIPVRREYIAGSADFKLKLTADEMCEIDGGEATVTINGTMGIADDDDDISLMAVTESYSVNDIVLGDPLTLSSPVKTGSSDHSNSSNYYDTNGKYYNLMWQDNVGAPKSWFVYYSGTTAASWTLDPDYRGAHLSGAQLSWKRNGSDARINVGFVGSYSTDADWSSYDGSMAYDTTANFGGNNYVKENVFCDYWDPKRITVWNVGHCEDCNNLYIESITPIYRPFIVDLNASDDLKFLNENGNQVEGRKDGFSDATYLALYGAVNTDNNQVVRFAKDGTNSITVTQTVGENTITPYTYLKSLSIVKDGKTKKIATFGDDGDTSHTVSMTPKWIYDNTDYISFETNNNGEGMKNQTGTFGMRGRIQLKPEFGYRNAKVRINVPTGNLGYLVLSGSEKKINRTTDYTYHRGDVIKISAKMYEDNEDFYKAVGVKIKYKMNESDTKWHEDKTVYFDSNGYLYLDSSQYHRLQYGYYEIEPVFQARDGVLALDIAESDLSKFDTSYGYLAEADRREIEKDGVKYYEYALETEPLNGKIYAIAIRMAANAGANVYPVWKDNKSGDKIYCGEVFFHEAGPEQNDNIITLSYETDSIKDAYQTIKGSVVTPRYNMRTGLVDMQMGSAMPASEAVVNFGGQFALVGENGEFTVPPFRALGNTSSPNKKRYVRYVISQNEQDLLQEVELTNMMYEDKEIMIVNETDGAKSTKTVPVYTQNVGERQINTANGGIIDHINVTVADADNDDEQLSKGNIVVMSGDNALVTASMADDYTYTKYTHDKQTGKPVSTPNTVEKITGIEFVVYNPKTYKETATYKADEKEDGSFQAKIPLNEVLPGETLLMRVTTDRSHGITGITAEHLSDYYDEKKFTDADREIVDKREEELNTMVYPTVYTGFSFIENMEKVLPVIQHLESPVDVNFDSLPFLGNTAMNFDLPFVSVGSMKTPTGYRMYVGFSPLQIVDAAKSLHATKFAGGTGAYFQDMFQIGHPIQSFKDGLAASYKEAFKNVPEDNLTGGSALGGPTWKMDVQIGFYLDFTYARIVDPNVGRSNTSAVLTGAGAYVGVSAGFKMTWYTILPVVFIPAYFGIEINGNVLGFMGAQSNMNAMDVTYDKAKNATITFENYLGEFHGSVQMAVSVAIYVGIGLAGTIGIRGGGTFTAMGMWYPTDSVSDFGADLTFTAGIWIDLFLFTVPLQYKFPDIKFGSFKEYEEMPPIHPEVSGDDQDDGNDEGNTNAASLTSAEDKPSLTVREPYSKKDSKWLPDGDASLMSAFGEKTTQTIVENAYEHPDTQLLKLDDGSVFMAFIDNDTSRGDTERTVLKYSVYKNGRWSEPKVVQDDGTADYQPSVCVAGDGKVMISWLSRDGENGTTTDSTEYLKGMEVYTTDIDVASGTVGEITRLTNDDYYDYTPTSVYDEVTGDKMVYYVKTSSSRTAEEMINSYMNDCVVVYMLYSKDKGWMFNEYYPEELSDSNGNGSTDDEKQELVSNWHGQRFLSSPLPELGMDVPNISDFTATSYNGIAVYAYTIDQDSSNDTTFDKELFIQCYDFATHTTYVPIRLTDDSVSDALPQFVRTEGKTEDIPDGATEITKADMASTKLFWYRDEKEVDYIDISSLVKEGVNDDGTIKEDYLKSADGGEVKGLDSLYSHVAVPAENPSASRYMADFKPVVDGDDIYVVWTQPASTNETDEDGNIVQCREVYATALVQDENAAAPSEGESADGAGCSWASPYRLTNTNAFTDEPNAVVDSNGNLMVLYNSFNQELTGDKNNPVKITDFNLMASYMEPCGAVDVTDIQALNETPLPGETVEVRADVKNNGLTYANGYDLKVYAAKNGQKQGEPVFINTEGSDSKLLPGNTDTYMFEWTVPESGVDGMSFIAEVQEHGMENVSIYESEKFEEKPVYTVDNVDSYQDAGGYHVKYNITNTGNAPSNSGDKMNVIFSGPYDMAIGLTPEECDWGSAEIGALDVDETASYKVDLDVIPEKFDEIGFVDCLLIGKDKEGHFNTAGENIRLLSVMPTTLLLNGEEFPEKIELTEGDTMEFNITCEPSSLSEGMDALLGTDDTSIATFNGPTLKALSEGTTVIHGNVTPYGNAIPEITVTVKPKKSGKTHSSSSSSGATPKPTEAPEATPAPSPDATQSPDIQSGTVTGETHTYNDVAPSDWFSASVEYATEKGYFSGVSDTEFEPYTNITRGMLITVIGRMAKANPESTDMTYTDVNKNMYYAPYIAWGTENGIVSGYSDTEFAPDELVTREQVAAMLYRYAKYINADVSVGEETNILSYKDADKISEYAIPAIQWACGSGIMSGYTDGTLRPQNNATRAEAAALTERFDNKIK